MSNPTYRYWQTESDGLWRFALVGSNGEPQQQSQGYTREATCLRGIEAARRNAQQALVRRVKSAPSQRGAG